LHFEQSRSYRSTLCTPLIGPLRRCTESAIGAAAGRHHGPIRGGDLRFLDRIRRSAAHHDAIITTSRLYRLKGP
jgi:hypothetical protein